MYFADLGASPDLLMQTSSALSLVEEVGSYAFSPNFYATASWMYLSEALPPQDGPIAALERISAGDFSNVTELATGLDPVRELISDDEYLWLVTRGIDLDYRLVRVEISSGTVTLMHQDANSIDGLTLDGSSLFWVQWGAGEFDHQLLHVDAIAGGTAQIYAPSPGRAASLVVDSDYLYWMDAGTSAENFSNGTIRRRLR